MEKIAQYWEEKQYKGEESIKTEHTSEKTEIRRQKKA